MKNLGLKARLLGAITLLTALIVGIAALGHYGIVLVERQLVSTYEDQVLPLRELKTMSDAYAVTIPSECLLTVTGRRSAAEARQAIDAARQRADAAWKAYMATRSGANEQQVISETAALLPRLNATLDQLAQIVESGDRERVRSFAASEVPAAIEPTFRKLEQLSELQRTEVAAKVAANDSDEGSLKVELIVSSLAALAVAIIIGVLLVRVLRDLAALMAQVQTAGVQVSTSVTEIAATAKQQQATANEIAATTSEIGATSKEISATSKELVKAMGEVATGAEQTTSLAGSGHAGLARMEEMMRHVMDAAGAISAKLAVLNEKAGNINQVVTTITKVADQTNLLSLNAAIEAEKAGEYGRGFAVVATEIRRLADQTAVATYDIEQIVKEMLSAVSASVMGMDKFAEEVRRGVDEVRAVSGQLSQIIEQVQGLTPRFETVNEGMQAQATGAQQISEALSQLSEAAQQTVESLRQSNAAITQLKETALGLRGSIERVRT